MKKSNLIRNIVAVAAAAVHFVPFYIAITVALKPRTDFSSRWSLPSEINLENFAYAINRARILDAMRDSAIITVASVLLVALLGAMAAYPLARMKNRFNAVILKIVLGVMMIPPLSMLVPLVTLMSDINGISTYWGIICVLVTFQLPLSIFMYSNFIEAIPRELDEAAEIDGCSKFMIFYRIILPLLKPVTATVVILTGVFIWNDYQFSLYILQSPRLRVVTLAVSSFFGQSSSNLGAAAACALIAVVPVIVVYIALQRYFVRGMIDSAGK
ncbi:MAG: carbohydrate ABC transporter permease [Planctomycetaceae bacterium]|nr:carbohydrate ABC transporter permease [Planctomycetaceae bacterium]